MSTADRIAEIVGTMDWVASGLAENGVECGDLVEAATKLNEIRLAMDREQFAQMVAA